MIVQHKHTNTSRTGFKVTRFKGTGSFLLPWTLAPLNPIRAIQRAVCLVTLVVSITGCGSNGEKKYVPLPLTEAHKKFIEILETDNDMTVNLFPLKNTVWIYIPITDPIVDYKATDGKPVDEATANEKFNVNYLDTVYENGVFTVTHDISMVESYPKDYGYGSTYGEEYNKTYRAVFAAIMQAYFSVGAETSDNIRVITTNTNHKLEAVPEFFVITIADITRGIQIEFLINIDDYRKQTAGHMPPEEYQQRIIYEMKGDTAIIDNTDGSHIHPREITMGEFLARQITNRVNFKYGRSSFPPSSDTNAEILHQVYKTLTYYDFQDYSEVKLLNKRDDSETSVGPEELRNYEKAPLPEGGKLHTIKFF